VEALTDIRSGWLFIFVSVLFALLIAQPTPATAQLKGTATYRERIALTPDAVFEAILVEDVSKTDAPAAVMGSVRIDKPGQVPIRFEIPYDPTRIDQSHSYSVRARILIGQQLLFTTDQGYPVLTPGHGKEVQLLLRMVKASKPANMPAQAAPLGTLPASFIGELPCADCPGIRYQVNLFPDRTFFSRMTYLGRGDAANSDDIGSWVVSSDRSTIILKGGREAPAMLRIKDANTLRMLDIEGRDIESPLNYDLHRSKDVESLEPRSAMRGMYRYFADAGWFTECLTRRKWPVAQEKDNAALESIYVKARLTPGEELLADLEGQVAMRPKMEGQGAQPTLVVDRFIGFSPGETCGVRFTSVPLENTNWKLTRLGSKSITVTTKQREPYFVLDNKTKRIAGFGGCNRFTGTYQQNGDRVAFGKMAMTFMACPEEMETERDFVGVLEQARSWKILGDHLELFDAGGGFLARFQARTPK
jgi:copper homeostasis protein (lipoprotein)